MPEVGSFFYYFMKKADRLDELSAEELKKEAEWRDDHSNAEYISDALSELIRMSPDLWKASARNVFVGLVDAAEVNATAWRTDKDKAIVEINLQFLLVLRDYVIAFDEFGAGLRKVGADISEGRLEGLNDKIALLQEATEENWNALNLASEEWARPDEIHPGTQFLEGKVSAAREDVVDRIVPECIKFIVGHEISHHMLAHLTNSDNKRKLASKVLREVGADTDLQSITLGLPREQADEINADVISFLLCAGYFTEGAIDFKTLYGAQMGAILTLTGLGHINGYWETDLADSHPGIIRRANAISAVTRSLTSQMLLGPHRDHPMELAFQLESYVMLAQGYWGTHKASYSGPVPQFADYVAQTILTLPSLRRNLSAK